MIKQKKEVNKSTKNIRTLIVEGELWCGRYGYHEYRLLDSQKNPETIQQAKRIAGDFTSLSSAHVRTSKIVSVSTSTVKVLA
jgi:hypothetical protein